jgi:hypothetical protein
MHQADDDIWAEADHDPGRVGAQAACRLAAGPARDHGTQLVRGDRDLVGLNCVPVVEALQSDILDAQLAGGVELVGQATVPEIRATKEAAIDSVGVYLEHGAIVADDCW